MAPGSPARTLGRLALRRVVVTGTRTAVVVEPWPTTEMPWSRTLWGEFMPDRRRFAAAPPRTPERRRG